MATWRVQLLQNGGDLITADAKALYEPALRPWLFTVLGVLVRITRLTVACRAGFRWWGARGPKLVGGPSLCTQIY